jgi:hypothetical protein
MTILIPSSFLLACEVPHTARVFVEAPSAANVPTPSFPPQQQVLRPIIAPILAAPGLVNPAVIVPSAVVPVVAPPAQPPIVPGAAQLGPTTVQAVEHAYFNAHKNQSE